MTNNKQGFNGSSRLGRILFQNRGNAYSCPGGDTVLMDQLAQGLRARGVEVVVDLVNAENPANFSLVHLFNFAIPEITRGFAQRAHAAGVPYVVTTLAEDLPQFHSQSRFLAERLVNYVRCGQDPVLWHQGQQSAVQPPASPAFDNGWVVAHAAALLVNGPLEQAVVSRQYGDTAPIRVVPVGVDTLGDLSTAKLSPQEFERAYNIEDFVLCVGRFESRKNQLMLLKALEHIDIPVVLISGGFSYQADYDSAVRGFSRKGRTVIVGRLPNNLLASAYAAARVHVLPSWYELPGLVSLEAALCGTPVVVTDTGTTRDYLGSTSGAHWCLPDDEFSVLQAVMAAYYSPRELAAPLKAAASSWSWERAIADLIKVYEGVHGAQVRPTEVFVPDVRTTDSEPSIGGDPRALLEEAERLLQLGENDKAASLLDQAYQVAPNMPRVLRSLGVVSLLKDNLDDSKEFFFRALAFDALDYKSLCGLAIVELRQGDPTSAFPRLLTAVGQDPYHLGTLHQLIQCSYQLQRFDELVVALERYCGRYPENTEMKFCLAGSLVKVARVSRARSICQEILSTDASHRGAAELLATYPGSAEQSSLSRNLHKIVSSVDFDQELLALEDEKKKRNIDGVIIGCDRLIHDGKLSPVQNETATLLRAEALIMKGEIVRARAIYDAVLARSPESPRALCGRAALLASDGKWEDAETIFESVRALDETNDIACAGLGLCAQRREDYTAAWQWYRKSLDCNPENSRALLGVIELGYLLGNLKEIEEAILHYLDHHPADLDFVYSLAGCYFQQKRFVEAQSQVEKIRLFKPDHPLALELSSRIAESMSGSSGAR